MWQGTEVASDMPLEGLEDSPYMQILGCQWTEGSGASAIDSPFSTWFLIMNSSAEMRAMATRKVV